MRELVSLIYLNSYDSLGHEFFLKKGKYYQLLTIKQIGRIIDRSRLKKNSPHKGFIVRVAFYKLFVDGAKKKKMKWDDFLKETSL